MEGTVYVDSAIKGFIESGVIKHSSQEIDEKQIQPSSLDLRCGFGKRIWHMPYSSIPKGNIMDFLNSRSDYGFDLTEKRFIHKKNVYIIELEEKLTLPKDISAKSNPKSTTGRSDIHTRLITEDGQSFDDIRRGYEGRLFLEIVSNSFNLFIPPGHSFNQIRFFNGIGKKLDQGMLEYLARSESLLLNADGNSIDGEKFIRDGAVYLTLDLEKTGYKVRDDAPAVDLSSGEEFYPASRYFEKVNLNEDGLMIIPDSFYLLNSKEVVTIPQDHCAEMVDISTTLGEFRAHYAGFFDPYFRDFGTMEVRNAGNTPFLLRNGQPISSLVFYALIGKPSEVYGKERGSHYRGGRVFPKFFRNDFQEAT